ncbi:acyl transferase/acyl hydrolase/lysophospholipase, partial [Leptodontidium sp. 2 PMI_412]
DGGGIRGLSSLVILKEIMERVGANMDPPQSDLKPCDYFDLIGGTSTGGIIAIMLGRLRMSVEECRSEYIRLGKQVFSNPRILPNESMFDASKLEAAIKDTIRRKLGQGNVDAPFIDPLGRECCKTVVYTLPASSPAASQPTAFRSYTSRHAPRKEPYTIWQAGRATSAATTFFEPLQTGSPPDTRRWIDAGMGFNNPARVIFEETGSLYGDARGHLDHNKHISVFLTLGTGFKNVVRLDAETRKEKISAKFRVPLKAIEVMQDIVTGTENVHTSLRKAFERKSDIYHRFNVEQGLQDVELYDYQQTEAMEADTENYTTARNVEIMDCVLAMAKLPLKLKPLDERGNPEEVFGTTGAADYKSLKNRLDALRM